MNWYNHKKNERHSFTIPSELRNILLRPWRSMTIILGAEVWRMVSVVLLIKCSYVQCRGNELLLSPEIRAHVALARVVIGQNYKSANWRKHILYTRLRTCLQIHLQKGCACIKKYSSLATCSACYDLKQQWRLWRTCAVVFQLIRSHRRENVTILFPMRLLGL